MFTTKIRKFLTIKYQKIIIQFIKTSFIKSQDLFLIEKFMNCYKTQVKNSGIFITFKNRTTKLSFDDIMIKPIKITTTTKFDVMK